MGTCELRPATESKPEPITNEIVTVDYVSEATPRAKFGVNPSAGDFGQMHEI